MAFDNKKLDRINELARIARERELTKEELEERTVLRNEYLDNFRAAFRQRLESIKIVHPEDLEGTN